MALSSAFRRKKSKREMAGGLFPQGWICLADCAVRAFHGY
jgi:hypothetical protein